MNFSISTIAFKNYSPRILLSSIKHVVNNTHFNLELWEKHFFLASDHIILNKMLSLSIYENFSTSCFKEIQSIRNFKKQIFLRKPLLVRVFAGDKSSHLMNSSSKTILYKNIEKYYSRYSDDKITLMFETHQGTFLDTPSSVHEFLKTMDIPDLKILLDIHNLSSSKLIETDFVELILPHTMEIHVKNTIEPQKMSFSAPKVNDSIEVINSKINEGFIPWAHYFSIFKKLNFKGNLVLEWFSKVPTESLLQQCIEMKTLYENA